MKTKRRRRELLTRARRLGKRIEQLDALVGRLGDALEDKALETIETKLDALEKLFEK